MIFGKNTLKVKSSPVDLNRSNNLECVTRICGFSYRTSILPHRTVCSKHRLLSNILKKTLLIKVNMERNQKGHSHSQNTILPKVIRDFSQCRLLFAVLSLLHYVVKCQPRGIARRRIPTSIFRVGGPPFTHLSLSYESFC